MSDAQNTKKNVVSSICGVERYNMISKHRSFMVRRLNISLL